jgi:tetratricopeptide (TPR) repeat protein
MMTPTVFISYSHKDEEWKDRLVVQLGVLQQAGLLDPWDDRRIEAGADWQPQIEQAMQAASVAVLMVSANFLTSQFILGEEVPRLLQRRAEEGVRVFPVIVKPCAWKQVSWLSRLKAYPKDGRPLSGGTDYQIDADLAAVAEEIAGMLKRTVPADGAARFVPLGPDKVSLAKLPSTSPDLFGRENELAALDSAWADPHMNILSLVAWGGVGKTALVGSWLLRLQRDNYRGAERVFGWSFYSQGAAEGRQVSADQFIAAALKWFGDPQMAESAASPWDKGERLAELIRQSRTLLVLDGLEPLQNPPPIETGRLKDPALSTLLRELARHNPGLVVITTRLAVDDLKDFRDGAAQQIDLEALSDEAGAAYLKHLGVKNATDEERKQASHEYKGHAFTLTLLGRYLADIYDGDVRKRDLIPRLTDEEEEGAHAKKMMLAYEKWFEGRPEQDILCVMGLFDRPAEKGALEALKVAPSIAGLTDQIQGLSQEKWQIALKHLRQARLLADKDPHDPDTLDCHPLLREHFGEQLRAGNPKAWREAHSRLYEYYKTHSKELPDTIEDMAPLFAAVAHGCQAGRHQEALDEVFWQRIRRGQEAFSLKKIGAFGSDLAALSGLFDPPWRQPVAALREDGKAFILGEAGYDLRALGRLAEAAQPMQAGLEARIAQENWDNAARNASNLSELYLTAGDLAQALNYAQQSVELADRRGEWGQRVINRTTLADALHQAGRMSKAEAAFREAEELQKARQPEFPLLYSLQGFRYCDLLLSQGKYHEVQSRAEKALDIVLHGSRNLLDIGLNNLSLGRAYLQEATLTRASRSLSLKGRGVGGEGMTQAATHLQRAVEGLRQAGQQQYMPLGLLARAELHRFTGMFAKAQNDLDEAFTIATRSGMRLHEADCHLEYARLYLAQGEKDQAREHLAKAKVLIDQTGYHRRDKDAQELEAMIQ